MLGDAQPAIGTGRDGRRGYFDCSSLAAWAYAKGAGIYIGDTTTQQWAYGATAPGAHRGTTAPLGGFQPGDLVFFDAFDHVGIYLGDDQFVQAPHTGADVDIRRFSTRTGFAGWVRYDQTSPRHAVSQRDSSFGILETIALWLLAALAAASLAAWSVGAISARIFSGRWPRHTAERDAERPAPPQRTLARTRTRLADTRPPPDPRPARLLRDRSTPDRS